jgi:hypothetical protein
MVQDGLTSNANHYPITLRLYCCLKLKLWGKKTTIILAEPLPDQTPYLIIEKNGEEKLLEIQDCLQNSTAFQQYSVRFCEILADSAGSGNMFVTNELTIDSLDSEISISSQ